MRTLLSGSVAGFAVVYLGVLSACGDNGVASPNVAAPGVAECRTGESRCGSECVLTGADSQHCGACGTACAAAAVCDGGVCSDAGCSGGRRECDRACVDPATDARHCGTCGNGCAASADCVGGLCKERSGAGGAGGGGGAGGQSAGGAGGESGTGGDGAGGSGGEPPKAAAVCDAPAAPTAAATTVVGTGTAASCTEASLAAAVAKGGVVAFDCGGNATIAISKVLTLPIDKDTTIDGGGKITLDAGGRTTRIFEFRDPDYRKSDKLVVLRGLTLKNAVAPATDFTPQNPANTKCAYGYKDGQGGAVFVRNGKLHVFDSVFENNRAAEIGPDTGGGAIYAEGSKDVTIVGSTFLGNRGSNGGAIVLLQSDGVFINSLFRNNQATGKGQNFGGAAGCPVFAHAEQGGGGGNSAAVGIDGGDVAVSTFCGVRFEGNTANELGTVARTPNSQRGVMSFDRCTFDGNKTGGGGALYTQDMALTIKASTFSNNTATGSGGAVRLEQGPHGSTLALENSTFYRNKADKALGGGLVFSGQGTILNCTFAENEAVGGYDPVLVAAYFGAALAAAGTDQLTISNTVFWNNKHTHPYTPMSCIVDAPLPGSHNFQWPRKRIAENGTPSDVDDNACTAGQSWSDAKLTALAENGGPTATLLPAAGSPVLGVGAGCPAQDQRGKARPATGCAAGAVEPD